MLVFRIFLISFSVSKGVIYKEWCRLYNSQDAFLEPLLKLCTTSLSVAGPLRRNELMEVDPPLPSLESDLFNRFLAPPCFLERRCSPLSLTPSASRYSPQPSDSFKALVFRKTPTCSRPGFLMVPAAVAPSRCLMGWFWSAPLVLCKRNIQT